MKTQTQHTPGPWKLDAGRMIRTSSGEFYISYSTDKKTGKPAFQSFSELDANARLIASAPDLLQVVEDYVLLCDLHDYVGAVPDAARATLRKARGGA
jgi:hypothetical protein